MNKYQARFIESVLKKVIDGKYTKSMACLKTGYSRPYLYELIKKYKKEGYQSLIHKNTRRAPINKTDFNKQNQIIDLYKTKYSGFNFTHFKEMLFEFENIQISYCSLHTMLTNAGFQSPKHQKIIHKGNVHPSRPRRECFGELIQIDGSIHLWFGEQKFTLHAAIDDATSNVVGAYFAKEETLFGYYMMFKQILDNYGIPQEFYADRRTIFDYRSLNEKDKAIEKDTFTQFKRCCIQLGVEIHTTSVSQAKGRVERLFGTLQDRLVSEMRLFNIQTVEEANLFLKKYIPRHNKKFGLPIDYNKSLFAPSPSSKDINLYLSIQYERIIDNGSSFSFKNNKYQLLDTDGLIEQIPSKTKILIYECLDNQLIAVYKDKLFSLIISTHKKQTTIVEPRNKTKYIPPPNHPWRKFVLSKKKIT